MSEATLIPLLSGAREFSRHRDAIVARIEKVLASGDVVGGSAVADLEGRLARTTGRRHAVTVSSGTDALHFALVAAGAGPGDEVLVTDFSFIASASAILLAGATPVFVDVDESYNMNLERAAERCSARTRALIFVHLYGQMSDPAEIEAFAAHQGLILIEDAAQALGASFNGRPAGSTGMASCFSFNSTKTISAPGGGGAVLTDDDGIAERVCRLRCHGRSAHGEYVELGRYSMMPTATAAVLDYKLDHDHAWQERRREIVTYFRECWSHLDAPTLPTESPGASHTYHKLVVRDAARTDLAMRLHRTGIETGVHYPIPLHRMPLFASHGIAAEDADYPEAIQYAETVLTIPAHHCLRDAEVELIADAVGRKPLDATEAVH
jgi:dTDP-4-amino-4,6-dideoxygalactose transaminase